MKKIIYLFLASLLLVVACQNQQHVPYSIIPEPQNIIYTGGSFTANKSWNVVYPVTLEKEFNLLRTWMKEDFGIDVLAVSDNSKATLVLSLDNTVNHPEGYTVTVESKQIKISAQQPAGIVYGVQTLRQIIRPEGNKLVVQKGTITDSPAFPWRAFMLDEARYFKGQEVVFSLLDEMVRLKMNVFHWHLTNDQGWRIEIKKYPLLTEIGAYRDSSEIYHFHSDVFDGVPHGGFYTQDQIREVVAYAAERNIMIVPEVSVPGHTTAAIAAYPWLGLNSKPVKVSPVFGVHYDVLDVSSPRVMEFISDVFDEIIALFPEPVVHIGGDEVRYNQWNASPKIQQYMRKNNLKTPPELQVFFTNQVSNMLADKGKIMMGWNEITGEKLHDYQEKEDATKTESSLQALNPDAIVHFWKGDPALIRKTVEKGYNIVNSYHEYTYIDYDYNSIPLEKAYNFNPIPEDLPLEYHSYVKGLGCQMWGEFIPTVESMNKKIYPRLAAYAETGWTQPEKKDYDRFQESLKPVIRKWEELGYYYQPEE